MTLEISSKDLLATIVYPVGNSEAVNHLSDDLTKIRYLALSILIFVAYSKICLLDQIFLVILVTSKIPVY